MQKLALFCSRGFQGSILQASNGRIEVEAKKHQHPKPPCFDKLMLIFVSGFFFMCSYSSDGEAGPREFSTLYSILMCRPTRHLRSVSRIQPDAQVPRKVWLLVISSVKTNIFFDWNKCKIHFIQQKLI